MPHVDGVDDGVGYGVFGKERSPWCEGERAKGALL